MAARVLKGLIFPLLKNFPKTSSCFTSVHSNVINSFPSTIATLMSPTARAQCHYHWLNFQPSIMNIHSLTDTRLPKRRPSDKPRRKRARLKPPGPYAWVQYVPGEPIASNRPNEGSVKGRKQRKRMKQRQEFILSEAKKRKTQAKRSKAQEEYGENRKKNGCCR